MKYCAAVAMFVALGGVRALADGNPQSNQVLVASVIRELGEKAINAFPDPSPILDLLETSADFAKLSVRAESTWNQTIAGWTVHPPDRASRLVLLHSYLYLSPKEYMGCLERLLDLFESGGIQRDELVYIFLIPPRDENRWFLSYNTDKPRMRKFLARVRAASSRDVDVVHAIDFITGGKARVRDDLIRLEKVGSSKLKPPLLLDD